MQILHGSCFFFTGKIFEVLHGHVSRVGGVFRNYSRVTQKFHGLLSPAFFVFPNTIGAVVYGGFFFLGDVLLANCKNTLLVFGGKVQNMKRLIPKAVLTMTGGAIGKPLERRFRQQNCKVRTMEDYLWEPPPAANKINTCRWCHRQRKAYSKSLTVASSLSVVSTIPRVARVYSGSKWLGGSKLTGWER